MRQSTNVSFQKLNQLYPIIPGLHVIGGHPDIGMTDFLLQFADEAIAPNTPIMFVSLTENTKEIGAKIVSRRIQQSDKHADITPADVLEGKASKSKILKETVQDLSDGKHIIPLHPNKTLTIQQLIKLLNEYSAKCTNTPVIIINAINGITDGENPETQEKAFLTIAEWQSKHPDVSVFLCCDIRNIFQRHMTLNIFAFPQSLDAYATTVAGIQLRELSCKEFYGTRDEEGDLHATPLRKQQAIVDAAMRAKTRHLRMHLIKGETAYSALDFDYDRNHAILTEI